MDKIIPPADQFRMGLSKLTQQERDRLYVFVSAKLLEYYAAGSAPGHTSLVTSSASNPLSNNRENPTRAAPGSVEKRDYSDVGGTHWIGKNIGQGEMLVLEDGSIWQVDDFDKIDAMLWLPTDDILVRRSEKGSPGYDYLLVNTDEGEKVHAKYLGKK